MSTLTGTGKLVRLIVRRDRRVMPLWIVLLARSRPLLMYCILAI